MDSPRYEKRGALRMYLKKAITSEFKKMGIDVPAKKIMFFLVKDMEIYIKYGFKPEYNNIPNPTTPSELKLNNEVVFKSDNSKLRFKNDPDFINFLDTLSENDFNAIFKSRDFLYSRFEHLFKHCKRISGSDKSFFKLKSSNPEVAMVDLVTKIYDGGLVPLIKSAYGNNGPETIPINSRSETLDGQIKIKHTILSNGNHKYEIIIPKGHDIITKLQGDGLLEQVIGFRPQDNPLGISPAPPDLPQENILLVIEDISKIDITGNIVTCFPTSKNSF